jgi:uncharacterized protein (DUF1697 family)
VTRQVAFLRAINVGGHVVAMPRLRALFEALKLARVETFIASGNVVFDSAGAPAALEARIERHLAKELGYEVATFLRPAAELGAIDSRNPFPDQDGCALTVGFAKVRPPADAVRRVEALATDIDTLEIVGREVYWRRQGRIGESKLSGGLLEKVLGQPLTMRNITTVRRLAAKYGGAA